MGSNGLLSIAAVALALCAGTGAGLAQATDDERQSASDVAALRACLKAKGVHPRDQYGCIFSVASACIGDSDVPGTQIGCHNREQRAWDSILNDSYRSLRDSLDDDQKIKLRDMQRAWLEARKRSCEFLDVYFQGSMAYPMVAYCDNEETARRAIFLFGFAEDAKN
jgi:uncharacterized protein YecT (DUF1311 family)